MIPIPSVDIKEGHAVKLVGGDPRHVKVTLPDPAQVAVDWARRGAPWLHIVDLDRALATGSNLRLIQRILEEITPFGTRTQVGGGVRFADDIDELLNAGATRVIVGTRAVTDPQFLEDIAHRYGKRIVIAVDAREDEIVAKGWTESTGINLYEFAKKTADLGVGALLYTDVGREGRLGGGNVERVKRLVESARGVPVIASGGVGEMKDLHALEAAGALGTVVGMAFYTGKIKFEDALKELRLDV